MDPRLAAAVTAGKLAAVVSRGMRRGGGTALPGLVAGRVDPAIVRKLGRQLGGGSVLITGTNGKTTTARILSRILREAGVPFLHNREGSNLMRGIASALLAASTPAGHLRFPASPEPGNRRTGESANWRLLSPLSSLLFPPSLGLFETDEASLPSATSALAPRAIAFTNLFRDQLDRYGEVDTVAALWREALAGAPAGATLVLNADDPSVAELALDWKGPVHWFGLDDSSFATTGSAGAFDARWCRACGGSFEYDRRYFAHVGHWRCTGCDRVRPPAATSATGVRLGLDSAAFTVEGLGELTMPLTGAYNVYNALAAIALARVLELPGEAIVAGLARARAAFGRQEVIDLEGRHLRLMLCKNPAGANQVLRLLATLPPTVPEPANRRTGEPAPPPSSLLPPPPEPGNRGTGEPAAPSAPSPESSVLSPHRSLLIALLLNDRFADGRDVSWIWDVDYELLAGKVDVCWAAGDRAEDIALRLKYAGWPPPAAVTHDPGVLLDAILAGSAPGADVFLVPTYTAMLDLRAELVRRGATGRFWAAER